MQSIIKQQYELNEIFSALGVHEAYSSKDMKKLSLLTKVTCNKVYLHKLVSACFDTPITVSITTNPFDLCLQGMQIIWRDGKWRL